MVVQLVQVDWTQTDTEGSVAIAFSFDDIESISIKKDSDAKASSATITLKNNYTRFVEGFTQPFTKYNTNTNNLAFKEGDTIKIYAAEIDEFRALDISSTSDDLIITGEIAEVSIKSAAKGSPITLKIVDKTYVILNRLYSFAYTKSAAKNSPEIIQDIVRFVTDDIDADEFSYDNAGNLVSNGIYAVDARLISTGGPSSFIEDTRQDDTSVFPDLAMAKVAKPAYNWIKELSSTDSTNDFAGTDDEDAPIQDRNMIFYIDELNRFHWFYPRDTVTTTLNGAINSSVTTVTLTSVVGLASIGTVFVGSERIDYTGISTNDLTGCTRGANNTKAASHSDGDTVKNAIVIVEGDTSSGYTLLNYSLTKKTFDIVNFVIFSAGADMRGNGITHYFFDRATKSKTLKETHKSYNDISSEMMQKEIDAKRLTQDNTTSSPFTHNGNRYKESTGDYDGGSGITTGWGTAVTTDSGYNKAFRDEAIRQGKIRAQALTDKRGSPRWKGTMEFKFHRFNAGELFEFTSTRAGINQQALRIKTAQYNITKSGAYVTLTVEEDEDKLGA